MYSKDHYDLIITTSKGDYHQDHHNTYNIVNSSCRGIATELWSMEISVYSNRNLQFQPNVFIDTSNTHETKLKAISCYNTYITDKMIDTVNGLNTFRAGMIKNAKYAEAFQQIFKIG